MDLSPRPTVAIRIHRLPELDLAGMVASKTVTPMVASLLRAAVRAGLRLVVSGGPGAGKTTLMRVLAHEIGPAEHLVTVEEERELGLHLDQARHPVVTPLEAREANAEGAGEINLDDLLKQALRHSPSRVIVGEVRGGEVTSMLRALGNGAAGGMCTLHAQSAGAVFDRIAALAQLACPPLPIEAVYQWTASAIDFIVHVERRDWLDAHGRRSRRRVVTEIIEVGPVGDSGRPDTTVVFGPGPDRTTGGSTVPVLPPSPKLLATLTEHGFDWHSAQQPTHHPPTGPPPVRGYETALHRTGGPAGNGWAGNGWARDARAER
jgi:pilus assembly protein CpaF